MDKASTHHAQRLSNLGKFIPDGTLTSFPAVSLIFMPRKTNPEPGGAFPFRWRGFSLYAISEVITKSPFVLFVAVQPVEVIWLK